MLYHGTVAPACLLHTMIGFLTFKLVSLHVPDSSTGFHILFYTTNLLFVSVDKFSNDHIGKLSLH